MYPSDWSGRSQQMVRRCGRNGSRACMRGVMLSDGGDVKQESRPNRAVGGSSGAKGLVISLQ